MKDKMSSFLLFTLIKGKSARSKSSFSHLNLEIKTATISPFASCMCLDVTGCTGLWKDYCGLILWPYFLNNSYHLIAI